MKSPAVIFEFMRNLHNSNTLVNTRSLHIKKTKLEKPQRMAMLQKLRYLGKTKLKDLAAQTGFSVQNLCMMYGAFEKDGLVAREIDSNDKRNTYYFITKKGLRVIEKNLKLMGDEIGKVFADLPEKDLHDLKNSLKIANDIIEKAL